MRMNADVEATRESTYTLVDVLAERAMRDAERLAHVFLVDGECQEERLTYGALAARAERVASALAACGAAGRPVVVLCDPGLEFIVAFYGCCLAGAIAVPLYPPDPRDIVGGIERIRRVVVDCGARFALGTDGVRARIAGADEPLDLAWCEPGDTSLHAHDCWAAARPSRSDVAFLQYTSGATGAPKGVMVTHGNVIAHGELVTARLALNSATVVVSWLPVYHDMGLVGAVLIPMQVGCRSIQMSPLAFLERPGRWLAAITRYGATLSPAPNFAYDFVVRRTSIAERRGFDLHTWRGAMNGAEPVRAETCERFARAFAPCGFRREAILPCYGLAEATLMVSGARVGTGPRTAVVDAAALGAGRFVDARSNAIGSRVLVGSGSPVDALEVAIVDPETRRPCADGEIGEVWIAGPTVAAGYWGRPEETAAIFCAHIADGRGPFLRTGDLGVVRDGELWVTGRRKDLIVIRGRNYYPQDVEHTAERAHPALRPGGAAAFTIDDADAERLVVVQEIAASDIATCDAAIAAIRAAVAREHQLKAHAVVLIPAHALPKTSSGKVRRRECRAALARGDLPVVRGWPVGVMVRSGDVAALEEWLRRTIADVRGVAVERVGRDDALVALGIDSADAAHVAAELEARLGRRVPLRLLMEQPTVAALATALAGESA